MEHHRAAECALVVAPWHLRHSSYVPGPSPRVVNAGLEDLGCGRRITASLVWSSLLGTLARDTLTAIKASPRISQAHGYVFHLGRQWQSLHELVQIWLAGRCICHDLILRRTPGYFIGPLLPITCFPAAQRVR